MARNAKINKLKYKEKLLRKPRTQEKYRECNTVYKRY